MTLLVILSTVLFTGIILALIAVLLVAESKLVQKGDVTIRINDDDEKTLTVGKGKTLLRTLVDQGIYLPSACGGGGTCGVCRCQVKQGGGDVLPTERTHLTQKEIRDHWRISCQVKVRENMMVTIPEDVFSIRKFQCTVVSNRNVASFIKELIMKLPERETLDFKPGGYVQIDIPAYSNLLYSSFDIDPEYRPEWEKYAMFNYVANNDEEANRAYSMANYPAESGIIKLNIRIASPPPRIPDVPPGIGSSYLFNLKPGDVVTVSGPYGEFFIKDTDREMVYIGGGAGMAPLRSHLFHLLKTDHSTRRISYWYGARSAREIFYADEFQDLAAQNPNFTFHIALSEPQPEDGWTGPRGFIHQVVHDQYLKTHSDPEDIEFYMCGPPMMNDAVNSMLYNLGVEKEQIAFDDFGV
ncbi:NADH:ubiquinone reductase (Na(+)-transporting) subunit F [bacterium]|nr:NADH:ubiquinone reductase (Na(+)-transporting) subunit F [candidate division CSSED10-310 bacterium]